MKITLNIEKEDLKEMYRAFRYLRLTSLSVQDYDVQHQMAEQDQRIKELVEPLIE